MPFTKEKPGGRPKGSKNKEDGNSLRKLLEGCFHENRLIIRDTLNSLCKDVSEQIRALNAKVIETTDISTLRAYVVIRENLLSDFKWLMQLKASVEPKQVEMSGRDGSELEFSPQITIITHTKHAEIPKEDKIIDVNRVSPSAN